MHEKLEKAPQILAAYLLDIKDISTEDNEHTYRTQLETLLNALKNELCTDKALKDIKIYHEKSGDKNALGTPDFRAFSTGLTLGCIENKRVSENDNALKVLVDKANKDENAQVARYLRLSNNLILTDYLRFWRVIKDEKGQIQVAQKVQICDLNELKAYAQAAQQIIKNSQNAAQNSQQTAANSAKNSQAKAENSLFPTPQSSQATLQAKEIELLELFKLFFSAKPNPVSTAKQFTDALAIRTRLIKNSLQLLYENPKITALYATFKDTLDKDLNFSVFCDSFAQTLTYSLFLAKLNNPTTDKLNLYNAEMFIPKSFALIRAMSGFLKNLDDLHSVKWLVEEILFIVNHINIDKITKELNKISETDLFGYMHKDPFMHFYEPFLRQYDFEIKKTCGVYYTPHPVVDFIINAVDTTLKSDFGCENGLGNALYKDSPITLLDFATGTGTFLLEAFRKALSAPYQKALDCDISFLIDKFKGFEFLIAPYTVAHLKISQVLKNEYSVNLSDEKRLNIYLTNTLGHIDLKEFENKLKGLGTEQLVAESAAAQGVKNDEILIITGNPPYNGVSANKGLFEKEVKITYGLEPSLSALKEIEQKKIETYLTALRNKNEKGIKENQSTFNAIYERKKLQNEKNPKWLLDDYVKFIRFAESKIQSQKQGIIAIISNNAFLDNPTFRGMRHHLLKTFDKIYILNLHGNTRKKELAPDGSKDDNVFDIMQGVCISVFVKTNPRHSERSEESTAHKKRLNSKMDSSLSAKAQNDAFLANSRNDENSEKIHSEMKENFTPKFREFIDKKYGEKFSPEQILGYIYAVLYHKAYREKFLDFLKIDFPKIPFVADKEAFLRLGALGSELVNLHCLKATNLDANIGKNALKGERKSIIECANYLEGTQELFVNESLYFRNVSRAVWDYKIGGYAVLDKYLKSHKGEQIDYAHFENIIKILHRTLQIEAQIAEISIE